METFEAIVGRRTVPPANLDEPGPDAAQLERLLLAAAAAPDHGLLRPFRILVVEGEGRRRLGELFADALARERPDVSPAELERQRLAPTRAPLLLLVVVRLQPTHPKIPEIEQIAAAAAATQNILLAARAMGFGTKWATGFPAASPGVHRALGLAADERLLAIVYVGTPQGPQPAAPRPSVHEIARRWP